MSDPSNSVSDDQAKSMGGADNKAGAHGQDTYEIAHERQLIIIARYKPEPDPFSADAMESAGGLISSVTGAIEKATNAVEDVMASIPGLQMFIKEDKKDSTSEKEYKYEYTEWDSKISLLDQNIKKVYKENKAADIFNFSDTDIDGRKKAASKLYNDTIKSSLSAWSGYKAGIHLIGIGQGGNVINEVTDLLAKDGQFKSEDWLVKSVFYVGTSFYSDFHKLNHACLKSQGQIFNFNSTLDLTQKVIAYMSPSDDLLKFIQNSNSNTLSLAVGKIKLTIIKILSLFLGSSAIGLNNPHGLDKFGQIKPSIEDLVKQMTGMIKQIASEIASFIDPGKLPDFGAALDGFSQVPSKTGDEFSKFLDNLGDTIKQEGENVYDHSNKNNSGDKNNKDKNKGGELKPQFLMGVFNCLCPLLDQVAKAIATFDYQSPATIGLANQMLDNAGITEIYGKGESSGNDINLDNSIAADYLQERLKTYQHEGKIDKVNQLIADATKLFDDIGKVKVKDLSDDKKIQLATALYSIIQPMLISKKMVLDELQKWIAKLDFGSALKDISANKLFSFPGNALNSFANLQFEPKLNDSINHVDAQLDKLKGFFGPREYDLHRDTLYFIYNIHNEVINPFADSIQYYLDKQTGFIDCMHNMGCENQFSITGKNTYQPEAAKDSNDLLPTTKLPSNT